MSLPPEYQVGPLSLPLRMEAKRKRNRVGVIALVIGLGLTAVGVGAFLRGGAEVLGIWGLGFGVGLSTLGAVLIVKAAKAR